MAEISTAPFTISRVFDAPRDRVWKAWTEPERLKQWWGPRGFKTHTCTVDLRPGGFFHYGMTAPDGAEVWGRFLYREIVPPERMVVIVSFSDRELGVTRHPWTPQWPLQILSTMTLEALAEKKTRVSIQWVPYEATEEERRTFFEGRDSMQQGWTGTLDQLMTYLAKG
jgi:uncharacterized protein YndB with AHSA1/START domain